MAGMLRLKSEDELRALLARGTLREARGIVAGVPFSSPEERQARQAVENAQVRKVEHRITPVPKPPKVKKAKAPSEIEELLAQQLAGSILPAATREYPHLRGSRHRLDFAWPDWRLNGMQIGVEVQGMAHRIKGRFSADLEKRAMSLLQGWIVLEVGGDQVRSGRALEWLLEIFKKAKS